MRFRFDCIFYYVSNLEAAVAFYRDLLGFHLASRDLVARFELGPVLFEIVPGAVERGRSNGRLCLQVENVAQALHELQIKGVIVHASEVKENGVLGRFEDLDGNEICLWEYTT